MYTQQLGIISVSVFTFLATVTYCSYSYILKLVGVLVGLKEVVLWFKERGRSLYTVCVGKD